MRSLSTTSLDKLAGEFGGRRTMQAVSKLVSIAWQQVNYVSVMFLRRKLPMRGG